MNKATRNSTASQAKKDQMLQDAVPITTVEDPRHGASMNDNDEDDHPDEEETKRQTIEETATTDAELTNDTDEPTPNINNNLKSSNDQPSHPPMHAPMPKEPPTTPVNQAPTAPTMATPASTYEFIINQLHRTQQQTDERITRNENRLVAQITLLETRMDTLFQSLAINRNSHNNEPRPYQAITPIKPMKHDSNYRTRIDAFNIGMAIRGWTPVFDHTVPIDTISPRILSMSREAMIAFFTNTNRHGHDVLRLGMSHAAIAHKDAREIYTMLEDAFIAESPAMVSTNIQDLMAKLQTKPTTYDHLSTTWNEVEALMERGSRVRQLHYDICKTGLNTIFESYIASLANNTVAHNMNTKLTNDTAAQRALTETERQDTVAELLTDTAQALLKIAKTYASTGSATHTFTPTPIWFASSDAIAKRAERG